MTRAKSIAILSATAASLLLPASAHSGPDPTNRAELFFGLGLVTGSEHTVGGAELHAGDGPSLDVRFHFHFDRIVGLQVEGMAEGDRARFKLPCCPPVSSTASTDFYLANVLFDLTPGPVSPFVALGGGAYSSSGVKLVGSGLMAFTKSDSGGVYDASLGVEGRARPSLVWAFEGRYLYYKFSEFPINRYRFSGHLGFRF